MVRQLLFAFLLIAVTTSCDLLNNNTVILIEGRLIDYYTQQPITISKRVFVNSYERNPLKAPQYQPVESFYADRNGKFSFRLRRQSGRHYALSVPPGEGYGLSIPIYQPIGNGPQEYAELQLKPLRQYLRVNIRCRQSLPDGFQLLSQVVTPYGPETRNLVDQSLLLTGTDTSLLLPAVPEEAHRVTVTAWFYAADSSQVWSHIVDVTLDTVAVDFNF